MENIEISQISQYLAAHVARGASATHIADVVAATWGNIDVALVKVIGRQGIDVMFRRSLIVTAPAVSWRFPSAYDRQSVSDLFELKAFLATQTLDEAASAGATLLYTFCESLANLIGRALAERLLRPALAASFSPSPAQDQPS